MVVRVRVREQERAREPVSAQGPELGLDLAPARALVRTRAP